MSVVSVSVNAFNETGKYAYATIEYGGLVSYSMAKRGGGVVVTGIRKVTDPVTAVVSRPFVAIKDKTGVLFGMRAREERIKSLEDKLGGMEQRLATIEKFGIMPGQQEKRVKKKVIAEDKRAVLKGILQETKDLRD